MLVKIIRILFFYYAIINSSSLNFSCDIFAVLQNLFREFLILDRLYSLDLEFFLTVQKGILVFYILFIESLITFL